MEDIIILTIVVGKESGQTSITRSGLNSADNAKLLLKALNAVQLNIIDQITPDIETPQKLSVE